MIKTSLRKLAPALPRLAVILMVALTCFAMSSSAYAKRTKRARFAQIQVTTPRTDPLPSGMDPKLNGVYPLFLDGKDSGFTSPDGVVLSPVDPGPHQVEVLMPDGSRWTRRIVAEGGRLYCLGVTYRNTPKHCWDYPLTARIASVSKDGDTYTLKSDVSYTGDIAPTYLWTVTPSSVTVVGGSPTSPEITINTAEASGNVTVTLSVSVDDGSGNPGCRREDVRQLEVCSAAPITPTVNVTPYFKKGEKIRFTPSVQYAGTRQLNYAWRLEPDVPFTKNEQDNSITVDTALLSQRQVRAYLTVNEVIADAPDAACPPSEARAQAESDFDEAHEPTMNDLKARLDNLVIEVKSAPDSTALVYVHGPLGRARTVSNQVRDYLISTRGLDDSRVQVEPITDSDKVHIELWVWNQGAPRPPSNLSSVTGLQQPQGIQHIPGSRQRRAPRRR